MIYNDIKLHNLVNIIKLKVLKHKNEYPNSLQPNNLYLTLGISNSKL